MKEKKAIFFLFTLTTDLFQSSRQVISHKNVALLQIFFLVTALQLQKHQNLSSVIILNSHSTVPKLETVVFFLP